MTREKEREQNSGRKSMDRQPQGSRKTLVESVPPVRRMLLLNSGRWRPEFPSLAFR